MTCNVSKHSHCVSSWRKLTPGIKAAKALVVLLMLALSVPVPAQESQGPNKQQVTSLTSRERQIVLMVAEGLSNKDVGRRLNLFGRHCEGPPA
jgi:DNA-binding NarL/FixJ family response regulator